LDAPANFLVKSYRRADSNSIRQWATLISTIRSRSDKRDCQLRRPRIGKPIERIVSAAGGFHPPWRRPRQILARGAVGSRLGPLQAYFADALAAMIGAATILLDPIFQGLAISLLFGLASSTLLTVLVIPAIYVVLRDADAVR
jgi:hypothetical protein